MHATHVELFQRSPLRKNVIIYFVFFTYLINNEILTV